MLPMRYEHHLHIKSKASHFVVTIGSQMAVRLSAFRASRRFTPQKLPEKHGFRNMSQYVCIYIYIYIVTFGRMPPLPCNRKLDTPVVAMQPKVKHLHGYAHEQVLLRCYATES
jgi:hypothetical protein